MEGSIRKVLDRRGTLRCVRFESGNVGVVNTHGKTILVTGPFEQLSFAEHGFLRVFNTREFFIDMKNGELYAYMPKFIHYGDFEITYIGGHLCTRTKNMYEVRATPAEAWHGKNGLYLSLPYRGELDDETLKMMIWTPSRNAVCLLNGDDSGVYWKMRVFRDHTLLVMDDMGNYYHVKSDPESGKCREGASGTSKEQNRQN